MRGRYFFFNWVKGGRRDRKQRMAEDNASQEDYISKSEIVKISIIPKMSRSYFLSSELLPMVHAIVKPAVYFYGSLIAMAVAALALVHFCKASWSEIEEPYVEKISTINPITRNFNIQGFFIALSLIFVTLNPSFRKKVQQLKKLLSKNNTFFKRIPGPRTYLFSGFLYSISKQRHLVIKEMSKQYGGIFRMFIGKKPVIFVTDPKLMKEALSQQAFKGRPEASEEVNGDYSGIVNNNGEGHRSMRVMVSKSLHNLGASKNGARRSRCEEIMHQGCEEMIAQLKGQLGKPIDLNRPMSACIGKILMKFLFNAELEINNREMLEELERIENGFLTVPWLKLLSNFPFLKQLGFGRDYTNLIVENREKSMKFLGNILEGSPEKLEDSILHGYNTTILKNSTGSSFDDEKRKSFMAEIFSTGVETTKTTIMWAILYMCKYPAIQQEVQKELDAIDSYPTLKDEDYLVYTKAVLKEVQRISSVVFEGVSHMAIENTELGGYTIPKGTEINFHQYTMHHNEEFWENPEAFNPERFITQEHTIDPKTNIFAPFSRGTRVCPGQRLAEMNLLFMFSFLLKSFKITFRNGEEPSTEPHVGVILTPQSFKVMLELRKE